MKQGYYLLIYIQCL